MGQFDAVPKVIFFDAVGTLFGVRDSVGHVYAALAQIYGVTVDPTAVNDAFYTSFKAAPPIAFPGIAAEQIVMHEFEWWKAIAHQTFTTIGAVEQFSDFDRFFDHLYDHFATAKPWFIYEDTFPTLDYWRNQGVDIGLISNFDSRVHQVLRALGLTRYFDSITISTEVGAAKPSMAIFTAALRKHNCAAHQAWHVGDSRKEDYGGAIATGLRGFWLQRL
ncbi:MAG: HAD-IA family hydrolase [Cyanothece sp. SIO2G6]|nr:HAD-IA family hydrolase [Cyanothece sp. SIO2G6]